MPTARPTARHYVYLVRCANSAIYTGYSTHVAQRVAAHNAGKGGRYTRSHRPVELLISWEFSTKSEALRVEYAIKQLSHHHKLALVEGDASQRLGQLLG
jgi:putative endonuclease